MARAAAIRLCKGAYKEPRDVAFPDKAEVDAAYARLMARLLAPGRYPALATHDDADHQARHRARDRAGHRPRRVRVPDAVRRPARPPGASWCGRLRVRVYVPFGSQWYPYFMRRLAERPANVSFLLRNLWRERGRA